MIFGIGNDIVEIERIEDAISRTPSFLAKCFTENERALFGERYESLAGAFAAKEAAAKALGTGFSGFSLRDIEITKERSGKPRAVLFGGAAAIFEKNGLTALHISVSHSREYAAATAVAEK